MPESFIQHRPAKTWNKIVVEVDSRMTEAVAAYLADLSGSGIEISPSEVDRSNDKDNDISFEKITAYIPIGPGESDKKAVSNRINELGQFLANLSLIFAECSPPSFNTEMIIEEDWGENMLLKWTPASLLAPATTRAPSWLFCSLSSFYRITKEN
jgi:hypothetical protein